LYLRREQFRRKIKLVHKKVVDSQLRIATPKWTAVVIHRYVKM